MSVGKTDTFLADAEQQFQWYAANPGWKVAEAYLTAVQSACELLEKHPQLGPLVRARHPRLHNWRFFILSRPFDRHIIFYEPMGEDVVMRRVLHGHRDIRGRLLEPPEKA